MKNENRHKSEKIGEVVSTKMAKTVIVNVARTVRHSKYGKYLRRQKKFAVHDEHSKAQLGDKVRIVECRPMSRTKRWKVAEVLVKAGERGIEL